MLSVQLLLLVAASVAGPQHFDVAAAFEPPTKPGATGAIAVTFAPRDPDVHINEDPAPRLRLDLEQSALVDKQPPPPKTATTFDPDTARYVDVKKPVRFPVAFAADAPKGPQSVKATVVYFYCSQREAWCRRGTADLEVAVTVP
ncbi:MAG: hypothetical protein ACHQKZ_03155 [Solirubrobacterales bacterium]|jgi:hypothetical protein